jgi:hypothetical protein
MMNQSATRPELTLSPEDQEAIKKTCLDYVDGWYSADPERMARALHPDLVKRTIKREKSGGWVVGPTTTAEGLVGYTREGGGSEVPEGERTYDIVIVDGFRHIATAKALSPNYMDYIHLAKFDDRWLIVNVLWEVQEGQLEKNQP